MTATILEFKPIPKDRKALFRKRRELIGLASTGAPAKSIDDLVMLMPDAEWMDTAPSEWSGDPGDCV